VISRRRALSGDAGASLVELVVAMVLFGVLGSVLFSTFLVSRDAVRASRETHDLNEEARVALNRMSRELRQATSITAVSAPDGATSITFTVDFNGNGVIDASTVDPEILTYEWKDNRILLTANDASGTAVTQPILAGNVSSFALDYFASDYRRDCRTPKDGKTDWRELDAYTTTCSARGTTGHTPGALDATELADIDTISISLRVLQGSRSQDYRTRVDLRNAR
jgi:type II secretory pathway pseudopilin PulG